MKKAVSILGVLVVFFLTPRAGQAYDNWDLNFNFFTDLTFAHSDTPQVPPVDWVNKFEPNGGGIRTETFDYGLSWDLGFGIEPLYRNGNFQIGLPVFYKIVAIGYGDRFYFNPNQTVGITKAKWWKTCSLLEVKLRKTTPAFGLSVGYEALKVQITTQRHEQYIEDFAGKHYRTDEDAVESYQKREYREGWSYRADLCFFMGYEALKSGPFSAASFGIFYEMNGSDIWQTGISLQVGLSFINILDNWF